MGRLLLAALAPLLAAGCTVYDPRVDARTLPVAAPAGTARVCGEAIEFPQAERVLAATRLFASVKRCDQPPDPSDIVAQVSRPYFSDKDLLPASFVLMVLSAGLWPGIHCQHDLAFAFHLGLGHAPVQIDPQRTTCALYGWLVPLLAPFPQFHLGRTPALERQGAALRAAILTGQPSLVAPASANQIVPRAQVPQPQDGTP